MEGFMHSRCLITAAAALAFAGSAAAEPPKPAPQPAPTNRPAEVMMASADQIRTPALVAQAQATPAKKPRAARVTTCRCAGQTPQNDQ
jgi:hypothetical protein